MISSVQPPLKGEDYEQCYARKSMVANHLQLQAQQPSLPLSSGRATDPLSWLCNPFFGVLHGTLLQLLH